MEQLSSAIASVAQFPWTKAIYSAVLLFFVVLLIGEVARMWLSRQVYVGTFRYYVDGAENEALGRTVQSLVLHQHRHLAELFTMEGNRVRALLAAAKEKQQANPLAETVALPMSGLAFSNDKSPFSEVELSIQGINFAQILTALRRSVSPPNEITGTISKLGGSVTGIVDWPEAPAPAQGGAPATRSFPITGAREDMDIAFTVACGLIWTEELARPKTPFAAMDRAAFCSWAQAWSTFIEMRSRREAGNDLSDDDIKALREANTRISGMIGRRVNFPPNYLLRADILSALPEPTDEEKRQIEADRLAYAAATQPSTTIVVTQDLTFADGRLVSSDATPLPDHLSRSAGALEQAAAGVGYLQGGLAATTPFVGSGFVVGTDLVATADFVVDALVDQLVTGPIEKSSIEFVLADAVGSRAAQRFTVSEVVYVSAEAHLAIVRVPGLAAAGAEPLHLAFGPVAPAMEVGVIGFPVRETSQSAVRSLMAGQLTAIDGTTALGDLNYDAATGNGTAGAPLVDLNTGHVIGLHVGAAAGKAGPKTGVAMSTAKAFGDDAKRAAGLMHAGLLQ